ncbi:MAG: GspB domain-containing protein [Gammaproteobacteria bacterium]|nr:general secretion pathway protein GspB [Gammaproteobacteria bacterium]NNC97460.1 GspB domain-containing protein [Gammaproteobacteria bacterium]NNM12987.1 GspB domain-containing protein [Gammaproteobacteria bacterium]
MSYILDALKRSDRSRQLNTTHEMTYAAQAEHTGDQNFWLKVAVILLSLVAVISLLYIFLFRGQSTLTPVESLPETQQSNRAVLNIQGNTGVNHTRPADEQYTRQSRSQAVKTSPASTQPDQTLTNPTETMQTPAAPRPIAQPSQNTQAASSQQARRSLSDLGVTSNSPKQAANTTNTQAVPQTSTPPVTRSPNLPSDEPRNDFTGYANYRSVRSEYNLPDMHLDILKFHNDIDSRLAFINMSKYRQGEKTKDGVEIMKIGKEGVLMSYQGRNFVLTAK